MLCASSRWALFLLQLSKALFAFTRHPTSASARLRLVCCYLLVRGGMLLALMGARGRGGSRETDRYNTRARIRGFPGARLPCREQRSESETEFTNPDGYSCLNDCRWTRPRRCRATSSTKHQREGGREKWESDREGKQERGRERERRLFVFIATAL